MFVLRRMQLPQSLQIKVALYFTLFCGVGFALFLPFRCITTLLVPTLFGYHGRTYVQTYLVTYMLSGHVMLSTAVYRLTVTYNSRPTCIMSISPVLSSVQFRDL